MRTTATTALPMDLTRRRDDQDADGIPDDQDADADGDGLEDEDDHEEPDGDEGLGGLGDGDGDEDPDAEPGEGDEGDGDAPMAASGADSEDPLTLIQQLADAERDYYAAKGFHGPQHHNSMALLDVYHKIVRKLVRAVGANGAGPAEDDPDADGEPDDQDIDAEDAGEPDDEKDQGNPFGKSASFGGHKYLSRYPNGHGGWSYRYSSASHGNDFDDPLSPQESRDLAKVGPVVRASHAHDAALEAHARLEAESEAIDINKQDPSIFADPTVHVSRVGEQPAHKRALAVAKKEVKRTAEKLEAALRPLKIKKADPISQLEGLFKARASEQQAGHKYLTRKPDGKGHWKYTYDDSEHKPQHGFSGFKLLDAVRDASESGRSGAFLFPHEGKMYSARIEAVAGDPPTLAVKGRAIKISPDDVDFRSMELGLKAAPSAGNFVQVPVRGIEKTRSAAAESMYDEKVLFTMPAHGPKKTKGKVAEWSRGWRYRNAPTVEKSEALDAAQAAFSAEALRKGIDGFTDDGTQAVIPERYLMPYLVSFIETSYGVVSQESPQQMYDEKAMAEGIMRQLVQSIRESKNLRTAAARYKVTSDSIAKILRDREIITVTESLAAQSTLPTDTESQEAMGAAGVDGAVFQLSRGNDWYKALDADQDANSSTSRLSFAPSPNKQTRFVDDRVVPRFGGAAGVALDYSERDRVAKASITANCVIHGYGAVQQTDMLTHAFGKCSCPRN